MHGHTRPLTQIKYNREGDLLFTAARDKSPNVWYSHNGERLGSYDGHNGAVYSLDMDYNTRRLLTASADNTAKLWDAETGKILFDWEFKTPVRTVEFALGDREALVLTDARMGNSGLLNIYAIANSAGSRKSKRVSIVKATLCLESDVAMQSVVLPGSRAVVARWGYMNRVIFTGHEDGTIMSWDPKVSSLLD